MLGVSTLLELRVCPTLYSIAGALPCLALGYQDKPGAQKDDHNVSRCKEGMPE